MSWIPDLMASDTAAYTVLVRDVARDLLEKAAAGRADTYLSRLQEIAPFQDDRDKLLRLNGLLHQALGYIQGKTDAINTMWADFGEELAGECPPNPHAGGALDG